MNSSRQRRAFAPYLCAAALLGAAAGASADAIYKQVDAAGRITYSDQPDPTPAASPSASARTNMVLALDVSNALARNAPIASRSSASINAREAALRLGKAQLQREEGTQPLPGEMIKGGGATAVNHRYWQRQEKLRRVVEQAQRRANATRPAQLARR